MRLKISLLFLIFLTVQSALASLTENLNTCFGRQPGMGMTRFTTQPSKDICKDKNNSLVYSISNAALFVCEKSENRGGYYVSAGSLGFGKKKEGDRKTPIGKYALGSPRPSSEFGIFIPIAYPNALDRKKGFTGGDVGIHGPKRFLVCGGAINIAINWTAGCLALASDPQILEIAEWVQKNPSTNIYIE